MIIFQLREKLLIKALELSYRICCIKICNIFLRNFISCLPHIIRISILDYIYEKCNKNREKVIEFIEDFKVLIEFLQSYFREISIYSLNYYSLISSAISDSFVNGFRETGFNKEYFNRSPYKVGYIHGHIGMYIDSFEIKFTYDYEDAKNRRIEWLYKNGCIPNLSDENEIHYNIFMVSGKDKPYVFLNDPFATYYQSLYLDIRSSDLIILIGYSLRDSHINSSWISIHRNNPQIK